MWPLHDGTLGDKTIISPAVTLNQDHLLTVNSLIFYSQTLASSNIHFNCPYYDPNDLLR